MTADTTWAPSPADARAAREALDPDLLETVAGPAVDYITARRAHYAEPKLSGRDTARIISAAALAVRAYQEHLATTPATAHWGRVVTRDADGTLWALCTTTDGRPFGLALDDDLAEALAAATWTRSAEARLTDDARP